MNGKNLKYLVLGFTLAATGLYALSVGSLTTFAPGTPIKSSEVNSNFSTLRSAIEALEAPIGPSRLADNAVTNSKLANNSVSAAKIVDEPGVAFTASNTGGTLGAFDTAPTEMLAITINAPATGFVLVTGTVSLELKHTTGSFTTAYTNINTINTSVAVGTAGIDSIPSSAPTGSYWHTVTVQSRLSVVAGNNTFYFMGARGPSGTVEYNRVRLSATFFPTSY